MRRREGAAIGIFILITLVVLTAIGVWYAQRETSEPTRRYIQKSAELGDLDITALSTGTVEPENRLSIKPPIAGRAEDVLVDEGYEVKKGQVLGWMSSTERAAMLDAASALGPAVLKRWEDFYKPTPILAPIAGSIILRSIEPGQTFTAQDALFVMSDRLAVKAQVDETDIASIQLGQKAEIVLDAYPDQTIPAQVLKIAFDAKTVSNVTTYDVDVIPETTPSFMRSGMTANVTFYITSKTNVLLIPNEALSVKEGGNFVLTPIPGNAGAPKLSPVEVGLSDGRMSEILSGLKEKDPVLIAQTVEKGPQGTNPFLPFSPRRSSGAQERR